ncbi:MAG: hypothetical protein EHM24_32825, partial [Acidobacteria bacterium]
MRSRLQLLVAITLLAAAVSPGLGAEPAPEGRLRTAGRHFVTPDGSRFAWRGLTSFRLLEMVAHGRAVEAEALLDWAAGHGVTLVRVLAMADTLFKLSPDEGRAALPRLLKLAADRGVYVEVVALADTVKAPVDLREQVKAVGAICAGQDNCLLEIANEPWHPSQQPGLGAPTTLASLRALVPRAVPVSLGSPSDDASDEYALGDYLTPHLQRSDDQGGWGHVLRMKVAER